MILLWFYDALVSGEPNLETSYFSFFSDKGNNVWKSDIVNVSMTLRGNGSCILGCSGGTRKRVAFNMCLLMDICCLIVELLHHPAFSLEKLLLGKLNCMTLLGYSTPWSLHSFCLMIYAQLFIVPYSDDLAGLFSIFLWTFAKFWTRKSEALSQGSRS